MTSPAVYEPWSQVDDVDVPVDGLYDEDGSRITHVRVPWVCAQDAQAVTRTATIVACQMVRAVQIAYRLQQAMENPQEEPQLPEAARALMDKIWDVPLVRFYCPGCDDSWDSWIGDDGKLSDVREIICSNEGCPRFRHLAKIQD